MAAVRLGAVECIMMGGELCLGGPPAGKVRRTERLLACAAYQISSFGSVALAVACDCFACNPLAQPTASFLLGMSAHSSGSHRQGDSHCGQVSILILLPPCVACDPLRRLQH
jgi:hypothetical protein